MASRGCGANRTAGGPDPDRQALWPGAGSRCGSGVPLPGAGFVGPHPKTATVERRERSRSPRDRVVAPRTRDRKKRVRLSALHPPLIGGTELLLSRRPLAPKPSWARRRKRKRRHLRRDGQTRTQQRAAGTNNTALFDIVNMTTANGSLRAPRCRTVVRADSRGAPDANRSPQRERGFSPRRSVRFRRAKYRPTARQEVDQ